MNLPVEWIPHLGLCFDFMFGFVCVCVSCLSFGVLCLLSTLLGLPPAPPSPAHRSPPPGESRLIIGVLEADSTKEVQGATVAPDLKSHATRSSKRPDTQETHVVPPRPFFFEKAMLDTHMHICWSPNKVANKPHADLDRVSRVGGSRVQREQLKHCCGN